MGIFIGLSLFIILLVGLGVYGMIRLKKDTERLRQEYEHKTITILDHIDVGIITISRDFIIDPFYNRKIREIFGEKEYGQTSIFDNIFYILEGDIKKELKEYIDTVFTAPNASEQMLNSINPVATFTYVFNEAGQVIHKKIKTNTVRIFNSENKIEKVMFIFQDISLLDSLEKEQLKRERDLEDQFRKISIFLSNDRDVINQFLTNLEAKTIELKSLLQKALQAETPQEYLAPVLRLAHSLKGEAFTIGFQNLTDLLKAFEHFLKKASSSTISIETQLEAVMYFEKIDNERKSLLKLIDKIRGFSQEVQKPSEKAQQTDRRLLLEKELQTVCDRSAAEEGKKIKLDFACSITDLSETLHDQLKEVLLHLIRNSASHGIEDPITRLKEGKPETGSIRCNINRLPSGEIILEYRDDGKGFDFESIRKKTIEQGLISKEKASVLKEAELLPFVFMQGFSTREEANNISGVGVGMAVVKDIMTKRLRSKIAVSTAPAKGITLRFTIPASPNKA